MRKSRLRLFAPLVMVFALIGAACANDNSSSSGGTSVSGGATGSSGAPQTLLDRIMADGVIRVATDPAYPPQSSYDEATNTWEGFDIDVANEISKRLGLTQPVDWPTPSSCGRRYLITSPSFSPALARRAKMRPQLEPS